MPEAVSVVHDDADMPLVRQKRDGFKSKDRRVDQATCPP